MNLLHQPVDYYTDKWPIEQENLDVTYSKLGQDVSSSSNSNPNDALESKKRSLLN